MNEIKKELRSYIHDLKLIQKMEDQIEFYTSKLDSCTAEISSMPKGTPLIQDKHAEYIATIEDLKAEKYSCLKEMLKKKARIEKTILALEQPYKNILYMVYIENKELVDVAAEIPFEYKYTCRLHGKALLEYKKIRESEEKLNGI